MMYGYEKSTNVDLKDKEDESDCPSCETWSTECQMARCKCLKMKQEKLDVGDCVPCRNLSPNIQQPSSQTKFGQPREELCFYTPFSSPPVERCNDEQILRQNSSTLCKTSSTLGNPKLNLPNNESSLRQNESNLRQNGSTLRKNDTNLRNSGLNLHTNESTLRQIDTNLCHHANQSTYQLCKKPSAMRCCPFLSNCDPNALLESATSQRGQDNDGESLMRVIQGIDNKSTVHQNGPNLRQNGSNLRQNGSNLRQNWSNLLLNGSPLRKNEATLHTPEINLHNNELNLRHIDSTLPLNGSPLYKNESTLHKPEFIFQKNEPNLRHNETSLRKNEPILRSPEIYLHQYESNLRNDELIQPKMESNLRDQSTMTNLLQVNVKTVGTQCAQCQADDPTTYQLCTKPSALRCCPILSNCEPNVLLESCTSLRGRDNNGESLWRADGELTWGVSRHKTNTGQYSRTEIPRSKLMTTLEEPVRERIKSDFAILRLKPATSQFDNTALPGRLSPSLFPSCSKQRQ